MKMPYELVFWTLDEIAEALPYAKHLPDGQDYVLYARLYELRRAATNPTPLGGDGSNGTVETPEERLDLSNDDKTEHWWGKLTSQQQQALVSAVQDEFGGQD
tara:strand:- start:313 stop:618 length:306 start_codon:yes stop_codon:yes gene_type:complete